jgi:transcriptional regulator with XRE-family HTH domain
MPKLLHVKALIIERDERQCDVAVKLGISPKVLSLIVQGRAAPWPALRRRMVDYLGVPEDELFPDAA